MDGCTQNPCAETHNLKDKKFSSMHDPTGIFSHEEICSLKDISEFGNLF